MSNLSTEQLTSLVSFFDEKVPAEIFTDKMRKYIEASTSMLLEQDDSNIYKEEIKEGFFYLTYLLEQLDPKIKS